jgi:ATP-dependent Lon protease
MVASPPEMPIQGIMSTEFEITMPEEVPVMTLPKVAFFPQALLPLHIFEPRYRLMLTEVLATNRLLAIAGLRPSLVRRPGDEPPYRVAGIGIIRACQKNDDGTSNLLLQGLGRVAITAIVAEEPFRRIRIQPLASEPGAAQEVNQRSRAELARLLGVKRRLAAQKSGELASFLKTIDDPETFVDIAAFSLCESPALKQKLLETLDVHRRLALFTGQVRAEIGVLRVQRKLQGKIKDGEVGLN